MGQASSTAPKEGAAHPQKRHMAVWAGRWAGRRDRPLGGAQMKLIIYARRWTGTPRGLTVSFRLQRRPHRPRKIRTVIGSILAGTTNVVVHRRREVI